MPFRHCPHSPTGSCSVTTRPRPRGRFPLYSRKHPATAWPLTYVRLTVLLARLLPPASPPVAAVAPPPLVPAAMAFVTPLSALPGRSSSRAAAGTCARRPAMMAANDNAADTPDASAAPPPPPAAAAPVPSAAAAPKGFGPPKAAPPPPSATALRRSAAASKYDDMKSSGMPEYNIWVRRPEDTGEKPNWYPVGSLTVPRSGGVVRAIYATEKDLASGALRLFPTLKDVADDLVYGYQLKEFPDEAVTEAARPVEGEGFMASVTNFFSNLTNPLNTK